MRKEMSSVLVLNAGYEPLHRVSIQHAIKMLVREVAVIEEATEEMFGSFPKPLVLRLVRYVKLKWRSSKPKWSRQRLMIRDNHSCGYCGKSANTVDHIVPRSKGGGTTWENTVAACFKCNAKKGNRAPKEAGMKLLVDIHSPSWYHIV
jgi:5-methylcytosine-specific restriction endonuclease McrA